nr:Ig-like domain-containing protein [Tenacibaculum aquimarinum]
MILFLCCKYFFVKNVSKILLFSLMVLALYDCARKGRPDGGPKDETAPILVTANPPNETIKFNKKKIRIYFDEYVVLKDLNKQLVVSPPMKSPPIISPQGTPSKYINIEILDTLKQNTTYTFNFGNAVQDNNENNKLESFKYVFSTGDYIDSLTLKGSVKDAIERDLAKNTSVLLYKLDSSFTDSIIYKKKPLYVSNTLDSNNYQFTNLQKGKYLLLALKEENNNYLFSSKTDKIAFSIDTISLPRDSVVNKELVLFKELQPYKFKRGKEVTKGRIQFGFEGEKTAMEVTLLSKVPENFKDFTQFEKDKDTLNYWFTPIEQDSLNFIVSNTNIKDTTTVFLRKKKIDSLNVLASASGNLHLNDTLFFKTNNPIVKTDDTKFSLVDKDTVAVKFQLKKENINKYAFIFDKEPSNKYAIKVLPNAFLDVYNTTNDSINLSLKTKAIDDYGSITLTIDNQTESPIILELLSKNKKVVSRKYIKDQNKVEFSLLDPQTYSIRAIIDTNKNNRWDTGDFLQKFQPEKIIYFEKELKIRANWILNETFTIK